MSQRNSSSTQKIKEFKLKNFPWPQIQWLTYVDKRTLSFFHSTLPIYDHNKDFTKKSISTSLFSAYIKKNCTLSYALFLYTHPKKKKLKVTAYSTICTYIKDSTNRRNLLIIFIYSHTHYTTLSHCNSFLSTNKLTEHEFLNILLLTQILFISFNYKKTRNFKNKTACA